MRTICSRCKGESHKASGKPCQDYAYTEHSNSLSMAIVSDGHGGAHYFRSDVGSKKAVMIARDAIISFVANMEKATLNTTGMNSVFEGADFTSFYTKTASDEQFETPAHKLLMWLFSSIINQWNAAITEDARPRDLTDWEISHVEQKYKDEFLANRQDENATFEKIYGCTLMAYVQTPTFWFAFHLGDGKLVSLDIEEGKLVCKQPVPWDTDCFINKTTSMCDAKALNEFRYCYEGNGHFPIAVFLGSDGMDDSYGDGEQLYDFYINVYKQIAKSGLSDAELILSRALPIISEQGSRDDMSVAGVFDEKLLNQNFEILVNYQKALLIERRDTLKALQPELEKKIASFGEPSSLDIKAKANLFYAQKDLDNNLKEQKEISKKCKQLTDEYTSFVRAHLTPKTEKKASKPLKQGRLTLKKK